MMKCRTKVAIGAGGVVVAMLGLMVQCGTTPATTRELEEHVRSYNLHVEKEERFQAEMREESAEQHEDLMVLMERLGVRHEPHR